MDALEYSQHRTCELPPAGLESYLPLDDDAPVTAVDKVGLANWNLHRQGRYKHCRSRNQSWWYTVIARVSGATKIIQDINQTCAKLAHGLSQQGSVQSISGKWGTYATRFSVGAALSCLEQIFPRILGPSKVQANQHHNIRPHVGQRKVYLSWSMTTTVKWKRNEQRWTKYIKQVNCRLITLRFYMFQALNWNNPNVSQCLFQFRNNLCSFFMGHLWLTPWS